MQLTEKEPIVTEVAATNLTPESASLLEELWDGEEIVLEREYDGIQRGLDGLKDLDAKKTVAVRREQAFLRKFLFSNAQSAECAICGKLYPVDLLVAAHIKPRSKCTTKERRDYKNNVLPLFERGYVWVEDGRLVACEVDQESVDDILDILNGRKVNAWNKDRERYFKWHASTGR